MCRIFALLFKGTCPTCSRRNTTACLEIYECGGTFRLDTPARTNCSFDHIHEYAVSNKLDGRRRSRMDVPCTACLEDDEEEETITDRFTSWDLVEFKARATFVRHYNVMADAGAGSAVQQQQRRRQRERAPQSPPASSRGRRSPCPASTRNASSAGNSSGPATAVTNTTLTVAEEEAIEQRRPARRRSCRRASPAALSESDDSRGGTAGSDRSVDVLADKKEFREQHKQRRRIIDRMRREDELQQANEAAVQEAGKSGSSSVSGPRGGRDGRQGRGRRSRREHDLDTEEGEGGRPNRRPRRR